jgi:hypothetical protein
MKKTILLFIALGMLCGCEVPLEDINDYFTECKIDSTRIEFGNSITVFASVTSEGAAPLSYKGFSLSNDPNPDILQNQAIANTSGYQFSHTYYDLNPTTTYYIRPWSNNYYGYSQGDQVEIQGIPEPLITPTCSPANNTIDLGVINPYTITYTLRPNPVTGDYSIEAGTGLVIKPKINFVFGRNPTTGVYQTTDSSPEGNQVIVGWNYPDLNNYQKLSKNQSVYVKHNSDDSFDITVCDATYKYNNITYSLTMKAHIP